MVISEDLLKKISPSEKKVFLKLIKTDAKTSTELIQKSGLNNAEVIRSLKWLEEKKLLELKEREIQSITFTELGKKYEKIGLPERRFLENVKNASKKKSQLKLDEQEITASIGILKRQNAISISKKEELVFSITKQGKKLLKQKLESEKVFENKSDLPLLKKRGLVEEKIGVEYEILNVKKEVENPLKNSKYEEKLTQKMLRDKSWKNKVFRSYDLNAKAPIKDHGKKHFVTEAITYIRNIWLQLGFEEMKGNHVQSSMWNLDALFVPQDHPARELQDTFYVDYVSDLDKNVFKAIKKAHETGGETGSKGWGYKYSKEIAQSTMLRTHNTVLTARALSKLKKEDLPKKYFAIGKVYRNEALDWKHLFEFQQVEGFVIDEKANFLALKNYLKDFFKKMGYSDVRIRPAYFPYTEPSAEVDAYNEEKKEWVEVGGAGILRPEVVRTLMGFDCKVLAWGLGLERIISSYYQIKDIREIYDNNINEIKNKKLFLKR